MNEPVSVVFASDNNYAAPLAVSILSLIDSARREGAIDIYILDGGISEENKKRISSFQKKRQLTRILFIKMNDDNFKDFPLFSGVHSIATYYRLKLPSLFPQINKIIYLDSDVVVQKDIYDMWSFPMKGAPLLAVEEPVELNGYRLQQLEIGENCPYFNGGVLIMNLAWMRSNAIEKRFIEYIQRHKNHLIYQDQDVLNGCFVGLWKPLPVHCNMMYFMLEIARLKNFHLYSAFSVWFARFRKGIIHYNQHPKPWMYGSVDPRAKVYLKYANLSQFPNPILIPKSREQQAAFKKFKAYSFLQRNVPYLLPPIRLCYRLVKNVFSVI